MLTLVNVLIVFFIMLICFQIILANHLVEGLETGKTYQPYDTNNPSNTLILAQQNAGNIEYLKGRIQDIQGMNKQVQDLSGNVVTLQEQVNGLVTAQQQYATQMTGGVAPEISGAIPQEDDEPTTDTSNLVTQ
jgi:TolA-binding protein